MRARNLLLYLCIVLFTIPAGAPAGGRNLNLEAGNRSAAFRTDPAGTRQQLAVAPSANAEESQPPLVSGDVPSAAETSPHSFEVSPLAMRFEYEEPSYMSEKGYLAGVSGRYRFTRSLFMLEVGAEIVGGSLDYKGSTWSGMPVEADTDDYLFELRSLFGGNLRSGGLVITPFAGLGLRYWNDTIRGSGGYEREITYLYSPIGLKFSAPITRGWSLSLAGEYDYFWRGWVVSHLSDANWGYNDPENKQDTGNGYGYRFSFEVKQRISAKFAWYIRSFLRYWDVERSDYAPLIYYGTQTGYVYEPENNTTAYGVAVGFAF